jgi:alpha-ketoglutarate-dependent 2,4-dichlorophenoxyacetate dioxygenase
MQFRALTAHIGAEVSGINLREPLSAAQAEEIHAGMDRYAVLVFHGQPLTNEQHLAFTSALGPVENTMGNNLRNATDYRLPPTFADVSNLDGQNRPYGRDDRRRLFAIGNRLWHSDSSFKAVPAKYSLLRAVRIPSKGGNTEFAHMGAAYEALDEDTKAVIENLVCEHSQLFSRESVGFTDFTPEERERFKPVRQKLVRTLPRTGRKSVYLSSHAGTVVGWPLPEARLLLRDLTEHATQREFVYSHKWQVDDLVMWDNRQTMHRGRRFDETQPRDVRRTTVAGDAPTVAQAGSS